MNTRDENIFIGKENLFLTQKLRKSLLEISLAISIPKKNMNLLIELCELHTCVFIPLCICCDFSMVVNSTSKLLHFKLYLLVIAVHVHFDSTGYSYLSKIKKNT